MEATPNRKGVRRVVALMMFSLIVVLLAPLPFALGRMPPLTATVVAAILLSGLAIAVLKDRPLTGTKVGLYWLGSALSLGWCLGLFVYTLGLDLIGWRPPPA